MWSSLRNLKIPKIRSLSTIPTEPDGPCMLTPIPGPSTKEMLNQMECLQNVDCVDLFVKYEASFGNYLVDVDCNTYLDLATNKATIPLGYNHPRLNELFSTPESLIHLINRPALEKYPADIWLSKVKNIIDMASPNLPMLTTMMCGSCANEGAMKAMMMAYQAKNRECDISDAHLKSAVKNMNPGTPNLSILSFRGSSHGTETMGALSATRSKQMCKLDVAAFEWPMAEFPRYKYPLDEFVCHNTHQDRKCLQSVRELIKKGKEDGIPVAGVIVEPIQGDAGNYEGSCEFFQKLQEICKENCCYLCMDETTTGCGATGTLWCHAQLNLPEPPDAVTFNKKAQMAGFFYTEELSPEDGGRLTSTWSGDPTRLLMFESILETINKDSLLCNVADSGMFLKRDILNLENCYFPLIESVHGKGTFLAFDVQFPALRDDMIKRLKMKGILVDKCGPKGIALRPALIFTPKHASIFIEKLEEVLDETVVPMEASRYTLNKDKVKKIPKNKVDCDGDKPCPTRGDKCVKCPKEKPPVCGVCSPKKKKPCKND